MNGIHLQEPVSIELGRKMVYGSGGQLKEKLVTFQYVPLENGLRALLSNHEIQDEVFYLLFACIYFFVIHYFGYALT